jgi:hypothetical protein
MIPSSFYISTSSCRIHLLTDLDLCVWARGCQCQSGMGAASQLTSRPARCSSGRPGRPHAITPIEARTTDDTGSFQPTKFLPATKRHADAAYCSETCLVTPKAQVTTVCLKICYLCLNKVSAKNRLIYIHNRLSACPQTSN